MHSRLTSGRHLLLAAALFHITICFALIIIGCWQPGNPLSDSSAIGRSFATDSGNYFTHATNLANILQHDGLVAWLTPSFPLHTRLYSLSFAALTPLVGFNILAAEPLNLFCYLAILFLVFKVGSEVFGRRVGLVSAVVIAIWPSLLLHTTQILKEPIFIAAFLGLVFVIVRLLTKSLSWKKGLRDGLCGGGLAILLWFIKSDFWELSLLIVLAALLFVLIEAICDRTVLPGNLVAVCLLITCLFAAPRLFNRYRKPNPHPLVKITGFGANEQISVAVPAGAEAGTVVQPPSRSSKGLTRLRERIAWARFLYANYPGAGSGIDTDIRFENWGQIVRYLPRAVEIGLFAPFPRTWFAGGTQVGRAGKILTGCETLLMYLIYFLAAVCLWKRRSLVAVWFLVAIAMSCIIVLSTVTANVGALYRQRYPFWILLIVIGVEGGFCVLQAASLQTDP